MQGGLITGKTDPTNTLTVEGVPTRVDGQGRFVFGIHGHHEGPFQIEVTRADGTSESLFLDVPAREYETQSIEGLPSKYVSPPKDVIDRINRENAAIGRARAKDTPRGDVFGNWIWPAEGIVSGVFGSYRILNGVPKRPHYGLDIAGPTGTPVVAPKGGVIAMAEPDLYYTGGTIMIDHGHGVTSVMSHLHSVDVAVGDVVQPGDRLGTIGATGRATGPHLDWRVNWFKARLDPQPLLPPKSN